MQSDLEVVRLQIFLWLLIWVLQVLEQKERPQSPLPLTQLASLCPCEKIPQPDYGADSNCKKLGNSQSVLWLVLWLLFGWSLIATTWTFSMGKDKKGRERKRIRKEESGIRKEGKVESYKAFLTPHSSSVKTLYKYCGRSSAVWGTLVIGVPQYKFGFSVLVSQSCSPIQLQD